MKNRRNLEQKSAIEIFYVVFIDVNKVFCCCWYQRTDSIFSKNCFVVLFRKLFSYSSKYLNNPFIICCLNSCHWQFKNSFPTSNSIDNKQQPFYWCKPEKVKTKINDIFTFFQVTHYHLFFIRAPMRQQIDWNIAHCCHLTNFCPVNFEIIS